MQVHTDVPALAVPALTLAPFFQRPRCPQCAEAMFAATATSYFGGGHIRHSWSCEACGHEFETAVEMPERLR
jgi:hypothetical protein